MTDKIIIIKLFKTTIFSKIKNELPPVNSANSCISNISS